MAESLEKMKSNLENDDIRIESNKSDKSYSSRDMSLIPSELSFGFIDTYAKTNNKSSGVEHMSKGIKYFSDGYVNSLSRKFIHFILNSLYSNIIIEHFTFSLKITIRFLGISKDCQVSHMSGICKVQPEIKHKIRGGGLRFCTDLNYFFFYF